MDMSIIVTVFQPRFGNKIRKTNKTIFRGGKTICDNVLNNVKYLNIRIKSIGIEQGGRL